MKKTYINPEMEIIELKAQYQMLAGSIGDPEDGPGGGTSGDAGGAESPFLEGDEW